MDISKDRLQKKTISILQKQIEHALVTSSALNIHLVILLNLPLRNSKLEQLYQYPFIEAVCYSLILQVKPAAEETVSNFKAEFFPSKLYQSNIFLLRFKVQQLFSTIIHLKDTLQNSYDYIFVIHYELIHLFSQSILCDVQLLPFFSIFFSLLFALSFRRLSLDCDLREPPSFSPSVFPNSLTLSRSHSRSARARSLRSISRSRSAHWSRSGRRGGGPDVRPRTGAGPVSSPAGLSMAIEGFLWWSN